jgi:uncharacterized phage protein (TIGR02216 family)
MALALGVLRWSPDVFWRATPREFAAALKVFSESVRNRPDATTSHG